MALARFTESALNIWWTLSGIFGGGMCGLFLLGMISRRAKNPAAVAGVVVGVAVILWMSLPKLTAYLLAQRVGTRAQDLEASLKPGASAWLSPFDALMVPVVGTLSILLVGLLVSRVLGGAGRQAKKGSPRT